MDRVAILDVEVVHGVVAEQTAWVQREQQQPGLAESTARRDMKTVQDR